MRNSLKQIGDCTESFKGLRLDPAEFYLVLLPLGIR